MKKKPRCVVSWLPNLGRAVVGVLFVSFSWSFRRLVCVVWKSFRGFSPMCFLRILQKCEICSKLSFLGPSICWRARKPGTRLKAQAWSPNNVTRQTTQSQKSEDDCFEFSWVYERSLAASLLNSICFTRTFPKLLKSGLCKSLQGNNFQPGIMNTCRDVAST